MHYRIINDIKLAGKDIYLLAIQICNFRLELGSIMIMNSKKHFDAGYNASSRGHFK